MMTFSPVPLLFSVAFILLFTLCGFLHIHGIQEYAMSGVGAALCVLLTRPWWKRGFEPLKRPPASFRDPSLGSRAKRRADQRRHKATKK